jgi:hypothetical protein
MDALVMELSDMVAALRAECARILAAAEHVVDKSSFCTQEDLADLGRAVSSLRRELDKMAPSLIPHKKKSGRRH